MKYIDLRLKKLKVKVNGQTLSTWNGYPTWALGSWRSDPEFALLSWVSLLVSGNILSCFASIWKDAHILILPVLNYL